MRPFVLAAAVLSLALAPAFALAGNCPAVVPAQAPVYAAPVVQAAPVAVYAPVVQAVPVLQAVPVYAAPVVQQQVLAAPAVYGAVPQQALFGRAAAAQRVQSRSLVIQRTRVR